jgi:hypothetical protein
VTPVIFIIGGIFVQRTWNVINDYYRKIPNVHISLAWLSVPIMICTMIATLGINVNYFFVVYPKSAVNIGAIAIAREIILDAPVDHVYLLGEGFIYAGHGTIRFLAGDQIATDLLSADDLPFLQKDGKGITILATYDHFDKINTVKSRYPQGVLSYGYMSGQLIFMKYRIHPLN